MITLTTADNALKSFYLDAVSEQLNTNISPLLARIQCKSSDVWGKDVKQVVRYGLTGGVSAGLETGPLPLAGENHYETLTSSLKNLYGTISISDKAIRASQNNSGAFVNLLNAEMEGLIRASNFNLGRMLYGDGRGVLATITATDENTRSVTVDSITNLVEGMIVDIYNDTKGLVSRDIHVISIDRFKKTIYLSKFCTGIEKDCFLTIQGAWNQELTGLGAIFKDTGTIYGLSREHHKWLIPYMNKEVGEITENDIHKAIDYLEETVGSNINFIVCSPGVKRALGYGDLSIRGIPVVADKFCPKGTMYLLNTNDFTLHQLCDWQWLEGAGGTILHLIPGKPVYTATLVKYAELMCSRPCGQAMLSGIWED